MSGRHIRRTQTDLVAFVPPGFLVGTNKELKEKKGRLVENEDRTASPGRSVTGLFATDPAGGGKTLGKKGESN